MTGKYLRIFFGLVLCVYAAEVFLVNLPQRVNLFGPLFLLVLALYVIVGPTKRAEIKARQKSQYQSYLQENPEAQELELRSKRLDLVAYGLLALAVVCSGFGEALLGNQSWIWVLGISALPFALGLGLLFFRSSVVTMLSFRASKAANEKTELK
jgi:hypothetical protein